MVNTLPAKKKTIEINGNSYEVTFPNNKQFINIFARKAQLSSEQYDGLSFSMDGNARYASMLVTAIATFENIMPEQFFKDINVKSILEGDLVSGAELVVAYRDQVEGWFNEWTAAIAKVLKPKQAEAKDAE